MKINLILLLFATLFVTGCVQEHVEYYESGEISAKYRTRHDKKEGLEQRYYTSGKILSERTWKQGIVDGKLIHYYERGDTMEVQNWENGRKQGKTLQYYPGGKVKAIFDFKDDKRIGQTIFYSQQGSVEKIDTYDRDGRIVTTYSYDKQGNIINYEPFLHLEPHRDTLLANEDNVFEARFINQDSSIQSVGFHFGTIDTTKQYVELKDTLDIVEKKDGKYYVHLRPERKEPFHLTGLYFYTEKGKGDTLSIEHVFLYEKNYKVK